MSEIRVTNIIGENGSNPVGLSTGFTVGPTSGTTGIGVTITHQGHAQFAGVCTATNVSAASSVTANTGNIIIGTAGKGIDYSAQTTSSASGVTVTNEVADHYEEATWTPVLLHYNSGSFQAPSYSAAGTVAGRYTRMGNIVYITASFLGYNISNATGSSFGQISGLPYPAANVTNMRGVINAGGDAFTTSAVNFATYWNTSTLNSMKYGSNVYDWGVLAGGSTKNLTISGFYHID